VTLLRRKIPVKMRENLYKRRTQRKIQVKMRENLWKRRT